MGNTGKWNIASLNVNGQAMFGDNNQMRIDLARLNVNNHEAATAAIARLNRATQTEYSQNIEALPAAARTELQQVLRELVDELKKPQESQNRSLLRETMDKATDIAGAVPALFKTAIELKSILGF